MLLFEYSKYRVVTTRQRVRPNWLEIVENIIEDVRSISLKGTSHQELLQQTIADAFSIDT